MEFEDLPAGETYSVFVHAEDKGMFAIVDGITQALVRDPRHGVQVSTSDDQITIDLYIIVEYQTRISSVAASVANTVHYQVERSLGMPVKAVNVHVQGLRVSSRG